MFQVVAGGFTETFFPLIRGQPYWKDRHQRRFHVASILQKVGESCEVWKFGHQSTLRIWCHYLFAKVHAKGRWFFGWHFADKTRSMKVASFGYAQIWSRCGNWIHDLEGGINSLFAVVCWQCFLNVCYLKSIQSLLWKQTQSGIQHFRKSRPKRSAFSLYTILGTWVATDNPSRCVPFVPWWTNRRGCCSQWQRDLSSAIADVPWWRVFSDVHRTRVWGWIWNMTLGTRVTCDMWHFISSHSLSRWDSFIRLELYWMMWDDLGWHGWVKFDSRWQHSTAFVSVFPLDSTTHGMFGFA